MVKFIFGMQINIEVFNKLILSHWVYVARHAQKTQNMKFMYLCNISRKTWRMQLIFCLQLNIKVFYKLIVWVCVVRHVQSTQNNKFAMPFQYLKENVRDEVDFVLVGEHQRFLQIDNMIFHRDDQAFSMFPK